MKDWFKNYLELTEEKRAEADALLRASADIDLSIANKNRRMLAAQAQGVIRQGVLVGSNIEGIFQRIPTTNGSSLEMPLDLLAPGTEKDFNAYAVPNAGRIPERLVEGDYLMIPTYSIGNSIDWLEKYARDARWDIVARCMEIFEAGFTKKMNDDGWHVLMAAAVDRNTMVYDSDATDGLFTKRLIELLKVGVRRNGGGNGSSINRFKLTHLATSPEAMSDMRSWGVDQIDEVTRREIFTAADGTFNKIFGVYLLDFDEFGEGQEYQSYLTNELAAVMNGSDKEFAVGFDLSRSNTYIMAEAQPLVVRDSVDLERQFRAGVYGKMDLGFAVLDNRAVMLASF